ncbi:MAG: hypothetical protein UY92_C0009G0007 [Candidatus Magasanikbacteria bacterium GW2011_GWA2_56_11]|uniref:Uncharacterized protein n=1 Tax=Candidatus Magasanikbacteria bacterium GW2011_GWA2_56_11 TaxID=1619044 RepID=A0A0G1YG94_9BACT|nr:MAG: hypothetical protein UY92_C0009G0007 [Candidatus Magasanikbacteria bacterium GW2011_GWA2_56_11]
MDWATRCVQEGRLPAELIRDGQEVEFKPGWRIRPTPDRDGPYRRYVIETDVLVPGVEPDWPFSPRQTPEVRCTVYVHCARAAAWAAADETSAAPA